MFVGNDKAYFKMDYFSAVIWLLFAGFIIAQIAYGVVLDKSCRPRYRMRTNPIRFWSVIAIQTVLLLSLAIVRIFVIGPESNR